jgi:hypothetical protein
MTGCLISAGRWLLGLDSAGAPQWRYDATIRVDQGMVAQVGAFEAVAYGNDDLPRYGDAGSLALPIFAPPGTHSLASRFGGAGGRLTPGSPAHVALFRAGGAPPSRRELRAAAFAETHDGAILQVFIDGRLVIDGGGIVADASALRAALDREESPEEAALWAAAACSRGR